MKIKKDCKVRITEEVLNKLVLPDIEYTVIDIVEGSVEFPIVINNTEQLGKDWVAFVKSDELILI
jgi:hypothetical protein